MTYDDMYDDIGLDDDFSYGENPEEVDNSEIKRPATVEKFETISDTKQVETEAKKGEKTETEETKVSISQKTENKLNELNDDDLVILLDNKDIAIEYFKDNFKGILEKDLFNSTHLDLQKILKYQEFDYES